MKITVMGGGSTYTPELVDGLILHGRDIGLETLTLLDIDPVRLKTVGDFCARMVRHAGAGFTVEQSLDLDKAIDGASFVTTQFRVGTQKARHQDILLGCRHDLIGQETTGVGGFGKALRTIPEIAKLVKALKDQDSNAWVVNFTNPSGIITESLLTLGWQKTVGLCNIPIGMQMDIAQALGLAPEDVDMDYAGLNHLAWVRHVYIKGEDRINQIIEMLEQLNFKGAPANIEDMEYPPGFLRMLGALPSGYLRYYYMTDQMLEKITSKPKTRAQEVMEIEEELLALYRDENQVEKPRQLSQRGGAYYSKIAVDIIQALLSDQESVQIVNLAAGNAVPGIAPFQTVEIPARLSSRGITPIPLKNPLAHHHLGLAQVVKQYETLTVQAALEGSYTKAWQALCLHPLCGPVKARAVLDDIIRTFNLTYLK